ncbi:hypothetical protein FA95DRAFT_1611218 [Auriscalpium vulgare]|uniref:Uncharacterized protein n=1 Tax=Auriscalpium vulgare TaxID=40419 RepID=A0ACB8RBZ3_9AGAM|nr:hypothetical protein FA95DRAFT_1611218 [Auriscalpium vulgare]
MRAHIRHSKNRSGQRDRSHVREQDSENVLSSVRQAAEEWGRAAVSAGLRASTTLWNSRTASLSATSLLLPCLLRSPRATRKIPPIALTSSARPSATMDSPTSRQPTHGPSSPPHANTHLVSPLVYIFSFVLAPDAQLAAPRAERRRLDLNRVSRSGAQLLLGMRPPADHVSWDGLVRHGELATAHFVHEVAVPLRQARRAMCGVRLAQNSRAVPRCPHAAHLVHRRDDLPTPLVATRSCDKALRTGIVIIAEDTDEVPEITGHQEDPVEADDPMTAGDPLEAADAMEVDEDEEPAPYMSEDEGSEDGEDNADSEAEDPYDRNSDEEDEREGLELEEELLGAAGFAPL